MKLLAPTCLFISLAACSAEQAYYATQSVEQSRCANGPANAYQECMERASTSYRDYENQRLEDNKDLP